MTTLFPELEPDIVFFVDSAPIPQPRMKISGFHRWLPKMKDGSEHPVIAYKKLVKIRAKEAYKGKPLKGPLRVNFLFLMPRPGRLVWKTKPMPRCWAPSNGRNDFDNLCKSLCDALTGILWVDDGQIVDPRTPKMYAAGDEAPGVHVSVQELT